MTQSLKVPHTSAPSIIGLTHPVVLVVVNLHRHGVHIGLQCIKCIRQIGELEDHICSLGMCGNNLWNYGIYSFSQPGNLKLTPKIPFIKRSYL